MWYSVGADLLVAAHLMFVVFVAAGGLLVLRWPRLAWIHLPAAAWGVLIELAGWICPVTPLEHRLRELAGEARYGGDFIGHYLVPVLYPEGLTRRAQIMLGLAVLAVNLAIYSRVFGRARLVLKSGKKANRI
jgi:hypothetical protein